jgi:pilus assembly protein Flp/PilA
MCRFLTGEEGATMVEYGLILVLVGVAAAVGLTSVGASLSTIFTNLGTSLTSKSAAF